MIFMYESKIYQQVVRILIFNSNPAMSFHGRREPDMSTAILFQNFKATEKKNGPLSNRT